MLFILQVSILSEQSKRINVYTHPECTTKRKKIYPYMKSPSTNATTKEHSSEMKPSRLTITLETQFDDHQREFQPKIATKEAQEEQGA